ncbi:MAG: hypothetical protein JO281_20835 [Pseudonocardiales bacterium]|nr:hypothetical protein [Pseudonocardiales bacterium]
MSKDTHPDASPKFAAGRRRLPGQPDPDGGLGCRRPPNPDPGLDFDTGVWSPAVYRDVFTEHRPGALGAHLATTAPGWDLIADHSGCLDTHPDRHHPHGDHDRELRDAV